MTIIVKNPTGRRLTGGTDPRIFLGYKDYLGHKIKGRFAVKSVILTQLSFS